MARPNVGDLIPIGAIGNAKKGNVLQGKTYSSDEGVDLVGTMPNNGAINNTITTQGGQIVVPEGYHDGSGIVKASFANLTPTNIKNGVTIGGVTGSYEYIASGRSIKLTSGSTTVISNIRTLVYTVPVEHRNKPIMRIKTTRSSNTRTFYFFGGLSLVQTGDISAPSAYYNRTTGKVEVEVDSSYENQEYTVNYEVYYHE